MLFFGHIVLLHLQIKIPSDDWQMYILIILLSFKHRNCNISFKTYFYLFHTILEERKPSWNKKQEHFAGHRLDNKYQISLSEMPRCHSAIYLNLYSTREKEKVSQLTNVSMRHRQNRKEVLSGLAKFVYWLLR